MHRQSGRRMAVVLARWQQLWFGRQASVGVGVAAGAAHGWGQACAGGPDMR
jgi:hypothetical protein